MILLKLLQGNSNIAGKFEIQLELRTTLGTTLRSYIIYSIFCGDI